MKAKVILLLLCAIQVNGESKTKVNNSIEPTSKTGLECINVCSPCCEESSGGGSCCPGKKGKVRVDVEDNELLQICDGKSWKRLFPGVQPLRSGLVGHWPMDEEIGTSVADFSGQENHATASSTSTVLSKYGRGRYFDSNGVITITNSASINFGTSSFTVAGWAKILDTTYPLTTFSVRKGFGCYFGPGRAGWLPGWEIAHGYRSDGTNVCIRDHLNNNIVGRLQHDIGYRPVDFIGHWVHFAFVYDRSKQKIFGYINGHKQQHAVDISTVTGNVNNIKPLEFGQQYGWKTKGTLDEYRLYNRALEDFEIMLLSTDAL